MPDPVTSEIYVDVFQAIALPEDFQRQSLGHELSLFVDKFLLDTSHFFGNHPQVRAEDGSCVGWVIRADQMALARKFVEACVEIWPKPSDGTHTVTRFKISLESIERVKRDYRLFAPVMRLQEITEDGPVITEEPCVDENIYQFCVWRVKTWRTTERKAV